MWKTFGLITCTRKTFILIRIFFLDFFLLCIFLNYISNAIPKVSHTLPHPLPYPPIPIFWPWHSPVLEHIKFACPVGLSLSSDGRLGHLLIHMQLESSYPDIALSCETMLGPSKHRSGCSQSAIGWSTAPPMEELEKVPKELKGSAIL
jgi:hypothetical protein